MECIFIFLIYDTSFPLRHVVVSKSRVCLLQVVQGQKTLVHYCEKKQSAIAEVTPARKTDPPKRVYSLVYKLSPSACGWLEISIYQRLSCKMLIPGRCIACPKPNSVFINFAPTYILRTCMQSTQHDLLDKLLSRLHCSQGFQGLSFGLCFASFVFRTPTLTDAATPARTPRLCPSLPRMWLARNIAGVAS